MPSYNKVILIGHLTRDVESKTLPGGTACAEFGVAVNHKRKDKEEVSFFDCAAFGKTAELIAEYFAKGEAIMVEGRLKQDRWEDKDGGKRSKIRVVVDSFTFVGSKVDKSHRPQADDSQAADMPSGEAIPF